MPEELGGHQPEQRAVRREHEELAQRVKRQLELRETNPHKATKAGRTGRTNQIGVR